MRNLSVCNCNWFDPISAEVFVGCVASPACWQYQTWPAFFIFKHVKCKHIHWQAQVLALIWTTGVDTGIHYQCVELFSGVGHVSSRFTAAGKPTAYFDKVHSDKHMNFESPAGFAFLAWTFTLSVRACHSIVLPISCFDLKVAKAQPKHFSKSTQLAPFCSG